jgi:hypothetical protein
MNILLILLGAALCGALLVPAAQASPCDCYRQKAHASAAGTCGTVDAVEKCTITYDSSSAGANSSVMIDPDKLQRFGFHASTGPSQGADIFRVANSVRPEEYDKSSLPALVKNILVQTGEPLSTMSGFFAALDKIAGDVIPAFEQRSGEAKRFHISAVDILASYGCIEGTDESQRRIRFLVILSQSTASGNCGRAQ